VLQTSCPQEAPSISWYWNEIGDKDSARYATTTAVWVSYLIAAVDGVIGIVSRVSHKPIAGRDELILLDAFLFTVIAWQIGRLSRAWAAIGFGVCLLELLVSIQTTGFTVGSLPRAIVGGVFLAAYGNALRGAFAYHKFAKLQADQGTGSAQTG
jgi:hypothetical protein